MIFFLNILVTPEERPEKVGGVADRKVGGVGDVRRQLTALATKQKS